MLTINTQGKQIIFMDFYPCKVKELKSKLKAVNTKLIQITANSKEGLKYD